MRKLTIVIDFDGTVVVNSYPHIGRPMVGAKETITKWKEQGHTIVIGTCRTNGEEAAAKQLFHDEDIPYDFFNENDPDIVSLYESDSRKLSGDLYFDDKNIGGFVGWKKADEFVQWKAHHKPVVLCIIGASGSGKTTLAEHIELNYGVKMIQSRTTRPPRFEGEIGHTFVSDEEFDGYTLGDMLAFTQFGDYRYCCLKSDMHELNTYVIDEDGYKYLQKHFGDDYEISSILVTCNETDRIRRAGRERVERDRGKFTMPSPMFDHVWETDDRLDNSTRRPRMKRELDRFIKQTFNIWT